MQFDTKLFYFSSRHSTGNPFALGRKQSSPSLMNIKKPDLTAHIGFCASHENLLGTAFDDFRKTEDFLKNYYRVDYTSQHFATDKEPVNKVLWVRSDASQESTERAVQAVINRWHRQLPKDYAYHLIKVAKVSEIASTPAMEHDHTKPREIKIGRIYVMGTKELSYLIVVRKLNEREFVVLAKRGGFGVTIETQFEKLLMENSRLMTTTESISVGIRHTLGPAARLLGIEPDYFDDFDNISNKTRDHTIR